MNDMDRDIGRAAAMIRSHVGDLKPRMAVLLGSGLGAVSALLEETAAIDYSDIPGFPHPTIEGHQGVLSIGTVNNVPVYFLKGRVHMYEGEGFDALKVMIRTLKKREVNTLVITSAVGSLHEDWTPGNLMAISDHINMMDSHPLIGPNDDEWGPRFPSQENAWDRDLRDRLLKAAAGQNVTLHEGIYCGRSGPSFETPAEVRMLQKIGGDAVGMSAIPENLIARHCGMNCVGIAAIVNRATGLGAEKPSHEQTLQGARLCEDNIAKVLSTFISICSS
ncbi:MAG: purine-nucleoside phosphorylase [Micavibrio sp.]